MNITQSKWFKRKITDYWDFRTGEIVSNAEVLAGLEAVDRAQALEELRLSIVEHTNVLSDELMAQVAVPMIDDLYKTVAYLAQWNECFEDYLTATAGVFCQLFAERGYVIQYVIDNTYAMTEQGMSGPLDYFPVWFSAAGFIYLCPQRIAVELIAEAGQPASKKFELFPTYIAEARDVANQLVRDCQGGKRHFVFLDTDSTDDSFEVAWPKGQNKEVLSVFRNEAPVPGSNCIISFPLQIKTNEQTAQFDLAEEVDRFFDDSSLSHGEQPRMVILMGGVASGKTTIRKKHFSTGYVLVDAAEIFLGLSRGKHFPFPKAFEEPMEAIGSRIARRAISERRHIVTEVIGAEHEPIEALVNAMHAIGYKIDAQAVTCDVEEAERRNLHRDDDSISAYYAEPYQRRWLITAATEVHTANELNP